MRTAVSEFRAERGLVIRLTLDRIQSWFTFQPTGEERPKPRIPVLTAYDANQEQRAIIHPIWSQDLSQHIHIVAQKTFSSYLCNFRRGEFLLHFGDMPNERRVDDEVLGTVGR